MRSMKRLAFADISVMNCNHFETILRSSSRRLALNQSEAWLGACHEESRND